MNVLQSRHKAGLYWVCRYNCTPEIAFRNGDMWQLIGNSKVYPLSEFEFIDPVPLAFPTYDKMRFFPAKDILKF